VVLLRSDYTGRKGGLAAAISFVALGIILQMVVVGSSA
jgi:hypothetical protein